MAPWQVIPPEVSDTENAALLYESAILLLKAQPAPEENLLEYLGELSGKFKDKSIAADELSELKQLIEQDVVARALWVVEQGTQRSSCRFDLDYEAGINMLVPHLSALRDLIRILGAKACIEAEAGRSNAAWELVQTQLRLADALRTEPVLIGQLVRIALVRHSCDTIKKLCEIAPPNGQQSGDLEDLLKSFDDVRPLVHAVDGERLLFGEWAFDLPKGELLRQHAWDDWPHDIMAAMKTWFKPTFLAYHTAYLRIMHESAQLIEQPYSPERARAVEEIIEKESRGLAQALVPAMAQVKKHHASMQADICVTRAGLALLRNKQTGGTFPETLAALDSDDVMDPFSGGPLLYRSKPDGFVLYSIGPDQKDNGGSPKQPKQETDYDIVWQLPSQANTVSHQPSHKLGSVS